MADERGVTHYDVMPLPPVEAQTEYFDAGAVMVGVEYRLLDDAIARASTRERAAGHDRAGTIAPDRGVALHVLVTSSEGGERREVLRFDCFDEDPHYHYVSWRDRTNQMIHIDPVAEGDPLAWALERIRTRLPQMLVRAGAPECARRLDPERLEAVFPRVAEAAWRARFHHDEAGVRRGALAGERP